ncbi:MAG: hypothetical protein B7Z73_08840, partial [Planctomycetia bacterium 21-64-5]
MLKRLSLVLLAAGLALPLAQADDKEAKKDEKTAEKTKATVAVFRLHGSVVETPHGGGLLSSAYDYNRFMTMLLGGGELDGHRLVSSRTLELMTENHLAGGVDLEGIA